MGMSFMKSAIDAAPSAMRPRTTPYSTQGRLHAVVVPIVPLISGQVEKVMVTNNQRVATGDVLFTINTDNYQLQLEAADADR